jgi:hypothetical protein
MPRDGCYPAGVIGGDAVQLTAGGGTCPSVLGVGFLAHDYAVGGEGSRERERDEHEHGPEHVE